MMNVPQLELNAGRVAGFFKVEKFQATPIELVDPLADPDQVEAFNPARPPEICPELPDFDRRFDTAGDFLEHPGTRQVVAPWQKNRILNSGKNGMAQQALWLNACQVGTDSTIPVVTQQQLGNFIAGTTAKEEQTNGAQGTPPYYGWKRTRWRFTAGQAAGNLNEVGVGWATTGSAIICRHRLSDANGDYATIVVQATELLDVTYEFRLYPPLVDQSQTSSITLDGTNYDTVTRALDVTNGTIWGARLGNEVDVYDPFVSSMRAWSGSLGAITAQTPQGTGYDSDGPSHYAESYVADSYQRVMVGNTGSAGWNVSGGIRTVELLTDFGKYQTEFSSNPGGNTIPKTSLYSIQIKWTLAWAEDLTVYGVTGQFSVTGSDATLTHNT